MEGLFRVFAQKNDADQIQGAADIIFWIDRLVEPPGQLFDLALGDAIALALRQHRQKSVESAVIGDVVEHFAAQGEHTAVDVMQVQAGHAVGHPVKGARDDPVQPRVAAGMADPDDHILSRLDLVEQIESIGGLDAHPAGEIEQDRPGGDLDPGIEGRGLAEGGAQPRRLDIVPAAAEPDQLGPGAVGAAIVDVDQLVRLRPGSQLAQEFLVQSGDLVRIILGQDDDRKSRRLRCGHHRMKWYRRVLHSLPVC